MKKILTFLVMLVASVSFLMAQAPQAKFNYQAVVRDRNHDNNLVMNRTIDVTIEILNGQTVVYTEPHTDVQTNRNGMVSFVINVPQGSAESANVSEVLPTINNQEQPNTPNISDLTPVQTQTIDWSNAVIRATFKEGNTVLSVVENDVMPVPYALSANVDPLEITTQKIVDYINDAETTGEDVGAIFNALVAKQDVSKAVRDSIVSYIKTQPELAKSLAIYFLGTVTTADVNAASNNISQEVQDTIKDIVVAYIKSHKDVVYDVVEDYLTNTTKQEVKDLWVAARANENFETIFNAVRDSILDYLKGHKDLVKNMAMYYMTVIDSNDVKDLHSYLKQHNQDAYNYMIGKLADYLDYYLTNEYMAQKACNGKTVCQMQAEIDQLKQDALQCPKITNATITPATNGVTFTATLANVEGVTINSSNLNVNDLVPTAANWTSAGNNVYTYSYIQTLSAGSYTFTLNTGNTVCNPSTKVVTYPSGN